MKKIIIQEIKIRRHLLILLLSILSIALFNLTYVSIILAIAAIILSIIFSRRHPKILSITIIISLMAIVLNSLKISNIIENNSDVNKGKNVLVGNWEYNENGGKYKFNKNKTYYQYINKNENDNFCTGTYEYKYGATKDNVTIREDEKYYYYTLTLKEDYCQIKNKKFADNYKKTMYFSIDKYNKNEIIMVNKETENFLTLKKVITKK